MMSQLRRILFLGLAVSIIAMMPCVPLGAAEPQADKADWENLKQLAPGTEIHVVLNDAKSYQGRVQTVSDEALVVRLSGGDQAFPRESILRVSSKRQSHRRRNVLLGAAIGAGAGLAIGFAVWRIKRTESALFLGGTLGPIIGIGAGAGAGAAISTDGWRDVYRAR